MYNDTNFNGLFPGQSGLRWH